MDRRELASIAAAGFAGALLLAATVTPVHAQQRPVTITAHEVATERVPYGDLVLTGDHDRKVLMRRVSLAVGRVCPLVDIYGVAYDWQDCRDFAWSGAKPQIKQAVDNAINGTPVAMMIEVSAAGAR
jgi:UrcA family protein